MAVMLTLLLLTWGSLAWAIGFIIGMRRGRNDGKKITNSPREMDWLKSGEYTADQIYQGFGVSRFAEGFNLRARFCRENGGHPNLEKRHG